MDIRVKTQSSSRLNRSRRKFLMYSRFRCKNPCWHRCNLHFLPELIPPKCSFLLLESMQNWGGCECRASGVDALKREQNCFSFPVYHHHKQGTIFHEKKDCLILDSDFALKKPNAFCFKLTWWRFFPSCLSFSLPFGYYPIHIFPVYENEKKNTVN